MKHYSNKRELVTELLQGSKHICDYVSTTYGPHGRSVVLMDAANMPKVTKDGVTVARYLESSEPFQNVAIQTIKQASIETVNNAGDGTTTAIILSHNIFEQGIVAMERNSYPPNKLKEELNLAGQKIVEALNSFGVPIRNRDDLFSIAKISCNGDSEIAKVVTDAMESTGKSGGIVLKNGTSLKTELEFEEGYQMPSGYLGPTFVNKPQRNLASHENPLIFVTDMVIDNIDDVRHLAVLADQEKGRGLIIIANEVKDKALAFCAHNAIHGKPLAILRAPEYGIERREMLQDIALALGARFVDSVKKESIQQCRLTDFGTCVSMEAGLNTTMFLGAKGNPQSIFERLEQLEAETKQTKDLNRIKILRTRINQLAGGCAVIKIGGYTPVEISEKRDRIEDAIEAAKSAKEKGILPGGAFTLLFLAKKSLTSSNVGDKVMLRACEAPFRKLMENMNSELSPEYWLEKLWEENKDVTNGSELKGIDFSGLEPVIVNLLENDILDPVKVVETALKNAISAASTLITVGAAIVEK
jgi:chaperonin GroEL